MIKLDKSIIDQIEPLYVKLGSAEKVAKVLNIGATTTVRYLKKLNYSFADKNRKSLISYSDALMEFKLWPDSLTTFCKKWHLCLSHFTKYLKKNGVFVVNHQNELKFNENIFDVIDTEEKAYWLGFLFADGYISSKQNKKTDYQFELSLKGEDVNHLHKFNQFMGHKYDNVKIGNVKCNGKIFTRCRWGVRNRHLQETLNSYGCTPRKSLTLQFPDINIFQSEDLIRHFIRGYFDGDGCVSWYNKKHTAPSISILSTESFLKHIREYSKIWGSIYLASKRNVFVYNVSSSKRGLKFLHYMYDNASIYLDRKFDRYLYFCRLEEQSSKLLQSNIGES